MGLDRRQRKTQQAIEREFIRLLQAKPLNKISVAEIVSGADISRSTFYLHYTDIYELYDQINNGFLDGLVSSFEAYYPAVTESYFGLAQRLIDYIVKNKKLSKIFINENNVSLIDKLSKIFIDKVLAFEKIDSNNYEEYYLVVWSVRGMIGAIINWINEGMDPGEGIFVDVMRKILDRL